MITDKKTLRRGKKIVTLLLVAILIGLSAKTIIAKEMISLPAEIYSSLVNRQKQEQFLQGRDISELNQEELQQLIKIALEEGEVKYIGSIEKNLDTNSYLATTGLSGKAAGEVEVGRYRVKAVKIDDLFVTGIPEEIVIDNLLMNEFSVGLSDEGEQIEDKKLSWWQSVRDRLESWWSTIKLGRDDQSLRGDLVVDGLETRALEISIYKDSNRNGEKDKNEDIIPWANFEVQLEKVGQVSKESFNRGKFDVEMEAVPQNGEKISTFLYQIALSGSKKCFWFWRDKKGIERVSGMVEGKFFGDDNQLVKGQKYQLSLDKPVEVWWVY